MIILIKKPSAWIPIALSVLAIAGTLGYIAIYGLTELGIGTDEGTPAHLFQLYLLAQVFLIGFFAIKWIPKTPKQAVVIAVLQVLGMCLAIRLVLFLEL